MATRWWNSSLRTSDGRPYLDWEVMTYSASRFVHDADTILLHIRRLVALPLTQRDPQLPDSELQSVEARIEEMKQSVSSNQLPPATMRHSLSHAVMDRWPLQSELAARIAELEQLYRKL